MTTVRTANGKIYEIKRMTDAGNKGNEEIGYITLPGVYIITTTGR